MAKYRKKPVVIEAIQWTGRQECEYAISKLADYRNVVFIGIPPHEISIETLEGTMKAHFSDWIIRGVQGEIYPVKDDIFEQTYELVEENN